jgi:hypothetical protein
LFRAASCAIKQGADYQAVASWRGLAERRGTVVERVVLQADRNFSVAVQRD